MRTISFHLDVVTAENNLFSGRVQMVEVEGSEGELGIYAGHTPLLTTIKPGPLHLRNLEGEEEVLYVSGGLLEVQPDVVTIMADTAIRTEDLDEQRAIEARDAAKQIVQSQGQNTEFMQAAVELTKAVAQLRAIELARKYRRR